MIKKKVFIATVAILSAVVIVQTLIITRPFARRHEVLTAEDAILIAQADLVRRYGSEEISEREFTAWKSGRFWNVLEVVEVLEVDDVEFHRTMLGYPPRVFVRISNGRTILAWSDGVVQRNLRRILD